MGIRTYSPSSILEARIATDSPTEPTRLGRDALPSHRTRALTARAPLPAHMHENECENQKRKFNNSILSKGQGGRTEAVRPQADAGSPNSQRYGEGSRRAGSLALQVSGISKRDRSLKPGLFIGVKKYPLHGMASVVRRTEKSASTRKGDRRDARSGASVVRGQLHDHIGPALYRYPAAM